MMKKQILALAISAIATGAAFAQAAAPAAPSTIDKVKASGVITMGTRESSGALASTIGDGKFVGFHVEMCQRIIAAMEKQIGKKVETKYLAVTSANRQTLMQNGTIDIECGSTSNTAPRQLEVGFLNNTYIEEVRFAVKANSGITAIAQLNGKNVATTTGTTSVQTLRRNERATGVDFKEVFGKDHADSFLLLETGRADAFVMDGQILAGNIAAAKIPADFKIVGEVLNIEPIAIMIRKDDASLKKLGNDVIADLVKTGEMAKLYDKWFMQPIPPKNARVGLPATDLTKAAWASLNSKPAEEFNKK
jgi:glutamate/aspartate transport system substrate-binding protein